MKAAFIAGIVAFTAVACGDPAADTPTPGLTATPAAVPFTIRGPIAQTEAFEFGTWTYFSTFVLDPATSLLYVINADPNADPPPATPPPQWLDDGALAIETDGGHYRISLGGDASFVALADPLPTMTPALMPDVPNSADGLWSAERNLAIAGITLTEQATGRRFDLPDTDAYQWSPAGHLMATGGGWCGNGQVAIVDPDGDKLTQIATNGFGVVYVWRPDGKALALDLLHRGQQLVLVDAVTGMMTTLIAPPEYVGEFVPLQWNPAGTHLMFRIHGGRDCSN